MAHASNLIAPLLTMKVSRYTLSGSSAYGEVFETVEDEFKCRIEPSSKRISDDGNNETIASAKLFCKGDQDIAVGDKIIWSDSPSDPITYYVLQVNAIMGFAHISHKEVMLGLDVGN